MQSEAEVTWHNNLIQSEGAVQFAHKNQADARASDAKSG